MNNITRESDYAIRIVAEMARKPRIVKDAALISENTGVTLRFALKILQKLLAAGIVKSYRGAHGGYLLTREPEEITLRQVMEAIDGEFTLSRCHDSSREGTCTSPDACICRFRHEFARISDIVRSELDKITF